MSIKNEVEVYNFIKEYIYLEEYAPTQMEIVNGLQISKSTVIESLKALEVKNRITRTKQWRSIEIVNNN